MAYVKVDGKWVSRSFVSTDLDGSEITSQASATSSSTARDQAACSSLLAAAMADVSSATESENSRTCDAAIVDKPDSADLASTLKAYEEAFEVATNLKLKVARMAHPLGDNQHTATWLHELGKVKLQTNDVNGAIHSFTEAEAIYSCLGKLKTRDGACLLQDLAAAKMQYGDDNGTLKACEGICGYAASLQSPAATLFLHDVEKLWHLLAPASILAAACAFMDDVKKSELEQCAGHGSGSIMVEEAKCKGALCTTFLKFGRGLLYLCS